MFPSIPKTRNMFPSFPPLDESNILRCNREVLSNTSTGLPFSEHFQNPDNISLCELGKARICTMKTTTTAGSSLAQTVGLYYFLIPTIAFAQPSRFPTTISFANTFSSLQNNKSAKSLSHAVFKNKTFIHHLLALVPLTGSCSGHSKPGASRSCQSFSMACTTNVSQSTKLVAPFLAIWAFSTIQRV